MSDVPTEKARRRSLLREPLVHFVVLGGLIFAAQRFLFEDEGGDGDARAPIVVTEHLRESLAEDRYRRVGERPEGEALDDLVASYVRDEALYREALRLGLDRGDTIVRRRLVQKMEFVLQGAAEVEAPSDEALRAHLETHAEDFRAPARVAFEHVFSSRDAHGDAIAAEAAAVMATLEADPEAAEGLGDPFPAGRRVGLSTEAQIAGRMGAELAAAVTAAPEGRWVGPFESSYGLHAVRVVERERARTVGLDEARDAVVRSYLEEARAAAAEDAIREIVAGYAVEGAPP